MAKVFISYSRKDSEIALRMADDLEKAGHSVWIDRKGIGGGSVWAAEIVKAIEDCEYFLLLLSSHSVQSDNVRKELDLAAEEKKRFLPVIVEATEIPSEFKYHLAGIQRVDFLENYDISFKLLIQVLPPPESEHMKPTDNSIFVDISKFSHLSKDIRIFAYSDILSVNSLLNEIWWAIEESIRPPAYTYGETWLIRLKETEKVFISEANYHKISGKLRRIPDTRTLAEAGIYPSITLEVFPLNTTES